MTKQTPRRPVFFPQFGSTAWCQSDLQICICFFLTLILTGGKFPQKKWKFWNWTYWCLPNSTIYFSCDHDGHVYHVDVCQLVILLLNLKWFSLKSRRLFGLFQGKGPDCDLHHQDGGKQNLHHQPEGMFWLYLLLTQTVIHPQTESPSSWFPKTPESIAGDSPRDREKTFTYDFSYDSTDSKSPTFVSQEKVNNIGAFRMNRKIVDAGYTLPV